MATPKKPLYSGAGTTGLGAFDLYGNAKQNKNALLSMQQFLNASNPTAKIKEDGVWGDETQGAWDRFNASPSVVAQTTANTAVQSVKPNDSHTTVGGFGGQGTAIPGGGYSYTADPFGGKLDGFSGLSNDAKNDVLYEIGKMDSYTPEQLKKLEGLDTSSLITTPAKSDQWINGLSNFETLQGAAGLGNLAMGLYGMFGENGTNAVNKKNMQLMDQQIANNRDIMATRKARAADIKKYFG